jgi:phosphate uptake regulator
MPSCSEVSRLCASEELRRAPLLRQLAVRFHLLMCTHCRRYVRELRLIGAAAREEIRRVLPERGRLEALELAIRERLRTAARESERKPPS